MSETRVRLCDSCNREWNNPDCGATEKDYEVIKGVGVSACMKYEAKDEYRDLLIRSGYNLEEVAKLSNEECEIEWEILCSKTP